MVSSKLKWEIMNLDFDNKLILGSPFVCPGQNKGMAQLKTLPRELKGTGAEEDYKAVEYAREEVINGYDAVYTNNRCRIVLDNSIIRGHLDESGNIINGVRVTLKVCKESVKTFKFMGLDITDELIAVVKLNNIMIYVGSLRDICKSIVFWITVNSETTKVMDFAIKKEWRDIIMKGTEDEKDALISSLGIKKMFNDDFWEEFIMSYKFHVLENGVDLKTNKVDNAYFEFLASTSTSKPYEVDEDGESTVFNVMSGVKINSLGKDKGEVEKQFVNTLRSIPNADKLTKDYLNRSVYRFLALLQKNAKNIRQIGLLLEKYFKVIKDMGDDTYNKEFSKIYSGGEPENVDFSGLQDKNGWTSINKLDKTLRTSEYLFASLRGPNYVGEYTFEAEGMMLGEITDTAEAKQIKSGVNGDLTYNDYKPYILRDLLRYKDEDVSFETDIEVNDSIVRHMKNKYSAGLTDYSMSEVSLGDIQNAYSVNADVVDKNKAKGFNLTSRLIEKILKTIQDNFA